MPAEPTYCTADDVREFTSNADLADEEVVDDTALEAKIVAAEMYIDAYAGYWDRAAGVTQARVFPRAQDAANGVTVPEAIKHATIAQVEFMYVNMPDIDHGIEPDASPTDASISPRAKKLMKAGFRKTTGSVLLPWPVNPAFLNIWGAGLGGEPVNGDIHFRDAE